MSIIPFVGLKKSAVDWVSFSAAIALCGLGLLTMNSFQGVDPLVVKQMVWVVIGVVVFFTAAFVNWRFLRRSGVAGGIYAVLLVPLVFLIVVGNATHGARSWFDIGPFAFQPIEFAKLALIIVLAKYFSRRHIEIRNIRHILFSGGYALVVFALVALQPDFGSAIIVFLIWLGMVLVSGISRAHLAAIFLLGIAVLGGLWFFGFQEYQRTRILTFLNPMTDLQGAGYNVYQSTVAVGSGQILGKGIAYGTQSKLRFLPEYQTDFIFAAFSEEWGLIGVGLLFVLYGLLFFRIIAMAGLGATNFETLFALGVLFYLLSHFGLHVGINIGLFPVTGTTIPFMSYGGSHIVAEFLALGMLSGMRRYSRAAHSEAYKNEFSGYAS